MQLRSFLKNILLSVNRSKVYTDKLLAKQKEKEKKTFYKIEKFCIKLTGVFYIFCIKLTLNTSHVAENGSTHNPTNRSATAKLTMKKFVTLRSLCEQNTAAITRQFPTITRTFMKASIAKDIIFPRSVHFTESKSIHSVLFIARCHYESDCLILPPIRNRK